MDRELPRQDEIWRHFNQYDLLNLAGRSTKKTLSIQKH